MGISGCRVLDGLLVSFGVRVGSKNVSGLFVNAEFFGNNNAIYVLELVCNMGFDTDLRSA